MKGYPVLLLLALFSYVSLTLGIEIVKIAECEANKYFWRDDESKPREFYACLTLKGRAVHMRCSEGSYMCKTGAEQFEPCACTDGVKSDDGKTKATFLNNRKKASDFAKQSADDENDVDGNDEDEEYDEEYYDDTIDDDDNTIDDNTIDDALDGLATFSKGNIVAAKTADPAEPTDQPGDDGAPESLTFESLAAGGCPDFYKLSPNTHMYNGVGQSEHRDLIACQRGCMEARNCIGVDWNKQLGTPDDARCFFIFPESTRYGVDAYHDYCCDHFRRTNCVSTSVHQVTPPTDHGHGAEGQYAKAGGDNPAGVHFSGKLKQYPGESLGDAGSQNNGANSGYQGQGGNQYYGAGNSNPGVTPVDPGMSDEDDGVTEAMRAVVTTSLPDTTTTIPDSGCPFTFEEYNTTSHPFGVNVTVGKFNDEVEECKYWCLVRSFCQAVDFNTNSHTCYYVPEVSPPLAATVTGVTHYRKVECAPPLKCWEEDTVLATKDDLSVTDPETSQTQCFGICFVRQVKQDGATVVQRGCVTVVDKEDPPPVGCSSNPEDMSMTCYCDTARCNGLSLHALANQLLYLPLDGDLSDHSGAGHHGVVPAGFTEPKFTCLDKSINCSALFIGSQCVTVESLARTKWGAADDATDAFIPQASFAVWFKRMTSANAEAQGIFGNSIDDRPATWRIVSHEGHNYVGGGVLTDGATFKNIDDYEYKLAYDGQWHLAVLTYNGVRNVSTGQFPVLRLYIDGMVQTGNAQADTGDIEIRDQPVSVGCVNGHNFVGFLDEARIFSTALEPRDIEALLTMRDTNHYYQGIADSIVT